MQALCIYAHLVYFEIALWWLAMKKLELLPFQYPSSEIFIGLVGPVGTESDAAVQLIKQALGSVNYSAEHVEISQLIGQYKHSEFTGILDRYEKLMTAGDEIRKRLDRGDALAITTMIEIWRRRIGNSPDESKKAKAVSVDKDNSETHPVFDQGKDSKPPDPLTRTAFILDQLKHHEEVETLRWVYGPSFFLVGAYTPKQIREDKLVARLQSFSAESKETLTKQARDLMKRDEKSGKLGQNVQKAYPLADVFINTADRDGAILSLVRFFESIFSHPFHTPSKDEQGMFYAKSASLRSADLARQIGAAITNEQGDLLVVGCNDAAKAGGGQYWTGDKPDYRDFNRGYDANDLAKKGLLKDILVRLVQDHWVEKTKAEIDGLVADTFSDTTNEVQSAELMSVIEYFRSVHAELAALMTAARLGISVKDGILYSTTFPCHECARHIVAAGIKRVVYVEPYPKSRVAELYPDSISVDHEETGHIPFEPFVGIAPRAYMSLFDLGSIERKDEHGQVEKWEAFESDPRKPQPAVIYLEKESRFINHFREKFKELRDEVKAAIGAEPETEGAKHEKQK